MRKLFVLLIISVMCVGLLGCGSDSSSKEESPEDTQATTAAANSTAKVDHIILKAKKDAKSLNTDGVEEAASYIADNYPDFYGSNEVMEKVIYYGSVLEYWELDTQGYSKLGQDAVQAVKYVYTGAEKEEDEVTQNNLRQIEKDAKEIVKNR